MGTASPPLPHVAIFPFMSKGHTIPLIHLASLLRRRRLAEVTFFTTPGNAPFLRRSLAQVDGAVVSFVELPFPENPPGLPAGVESTDGLRSMALFLPFLNAVKLLRPAFDDALRRLVPLPNLLICDGFLSWTADSATQLGIPRLAFLGTGGFASAVTAVVARDRPHAGLSSDREPFPVPGFPHLRLTKADLDSPLDDMDRKTPARDFFFEHVEFMRRSRGMVFNSFYELEPAYLDRWSRESGLSAWCVGPLCLAAEAVQPADRPDYMDWLDSKSSANRPVLYVAFGTQAELSATQAKEIAAGLDRSGLDFLWVVRGEGVELGAGFEERVGERGKVVRDWVDQLRILRHESVRGFVSHCGWNSVLESICAGVPILAWPMMADQGLNATFAVEELRIGLRIRASDGTRKGLVKGEEIERLARDLLVGPEGKEMAERAKGLAMAARKAMDHGGSSWLALERMIGDVCEKGSLDHVIGGTGGAGDGARGVAVACGRENE